MQFVRSLSVAFIALSLTPNANAEQTFKSPAEVYAAAQASVRKGDYVGLSNCLTGDSLEMWSWITVIMSQSARQQLEKDADESIDVTPESIDTVLAAHGLSKEKINRAVLLSLAKPKAERGKVFSTALKDVKHKPRFIVDAFLELQKMKVDSRKFDPIRMFEWIMPDFVDLLVDGKSAKAQVPQPESAKKRVRTVQFRKDGGGWLIYFPMDFRK